MASTDKLKVIDNYIYFYHLEKFCVLPMYPESISDNMNSTFATTNSLARSAPVFTFSNSGPRTVQITLELHRDLMNDLNKDVSNLKDSVVPFDTDDYVDTLINYLQSAALPKYKDYSSGSKSVIPPMVALRFGDDIFIKGIVQGGVQCTYKKPILRINGKDKYAVVTIAISINETDPYDAEKVVQSGSFRGISATFKNGIYNSNSGSDNFNIIDVVNSAGNRVDQNDVLATVTGAMDTVIGRIRGSGKNSSYSSGRRKVIMKW